MLFFKKCSMKNRQNNQLNYPYSDFIYLKNNWKITCYTTYENTNSLSQYVLEIINSNQTLIAFMNLETYLTSSIRDHIKMACKDPNNYIGFVQHSERVVYWDLDADKEKAIPFDIVHNLYPWIETQIIKIQKNFSSINTTSKKASDNIVYIENKLEVNISDSDDNKLINISEQSWKSSE